MPFDINQVHLAGADIDQKSKRERQVALLCKLRNGLLLAVLINREIVLCEPGNKGAAFFLMNSEQDIHQIDIDANYARSIPAWLRRLRAGAQQSAAGHASQK